MKKSSYKLIKLSLIIILLIILVYPYIIEISVKNFLNHPTEKSDLDWLANSVNCIKSSLQEPPTVGFFAYSISGDSLLMKEYQLQNLFVPIVLDFNDPGKYENLVIYTSDPEFIWTDEFKGRQLKVKCDNLLVLVQN